MITREDILNKASKEGYCVVSSLLELFFDSKLANKLCDKYEDDKVLEAYFLFQKDFYTYIYKPITNVGIKAVFSHYFCVLGGEKFTFNEFSEILGYSEIGVQSLITRCYEMVYSMDYKPFVDGSLMYVESMYDYLERNRIFSKDSLNGVTVQQLKGCFDVYTKLKCEGILTLNDLRNHVFNQLLLNGGNSVGNIKEKEIVCILYVSFGIQISKNLIHALKEFGWYDEVFK